MTGTDRTRAAVAPGSVPGERPQASAAAEKAQGLLSGLHHSLRHVAHRPWPVPARPWNLRQSWCDLLFAHWPVSAAAVRALVPSGLQVDEFEGTSWVGVVPFRMEGVAPRPLPDLPWFSAFPELNVRLYVLRDGVPGVWFLSLDATNPVAVWAARRLYHLPYFRADMTVTAEGEGISYRSRRRGTGPPAEFEARYRPTSEPFLAQPGSLEHWLTERYCLFAADPRGRLRRTDVHHAPWPLQQAEATLTRNTMLAAAGLPVCAGAPLLHFARRLDVVTWPPVA